MNVQVGSVAHSDTSYFTTRLTVQRPIPHLVLNLFVVVDLEVSLCVCVRLLMGGLVSRSVSMLSTFCVAVFVFVC